MCKRSSVIPVLAQEKVIFESEPLESPTGTIQDLQGIEAQAIAGQSENLGWENFQEIEQMRFPSPISAPFGLT